MANRFVDVVTTLADVSPTTRKDAAEMTVQELQVNILCTSEPGVEVLAMIWALQSSDLAEKQSIVDLMRTTFPTIDFDASQFLRIGSMPVARIAFGDDQIEPVIVRFDPYDDALTEGFRKHTALQSEAHAEDLFLLPVVAYKVLWITRVRGPDASDTATLVPVIATFYRGNHPVLAEATSDDMVALADGNRYVWGMRAE